MAGVRLEACDTWQPHVAALPIPWHSPASLLLLVTPR